MKRMTIKLPSSQVKAVQLLGFSASRIILIAFFFAESSLSGTTTCIEQHNSLSGTVAKGQSSYLTIESDNHELKNSPLGQNPNVTWQTRETVYFVPTLRVQEIPLRYDIPRAQMKAQVVTLSIPTLQMKSVKTGQYPEFRCNTDLVPQCTVKWTDITSNIPVMELRAQHQTIQIPEYTNAEEDTVVRIPDLDMGTKSLKLYVPQFLSSISDPDKIAIQRKADEFVQLHESAKDLNIAETSAAIHDIFSCYRSSISEQRSEVEQKFADLLATLDGSIKDLTEKGADPSKLSDGAGQISNLLARKEDVSTLKKKALANFDSTLSELDSREEATLTKLHTSN